MSTPFHRVITFVCAALTNAVLVSASHGAETAPLRYGQQQLSTPISLLKACPSWTTPRADRTNIVRCLRALSTNNTETLREAELRFVSELKSKKAYDIAQMSKLFLLNRFVFKVPEREMSTMPSFGGWEGIPSDKRSFNMLWPFSHKSNGELALTGRYAGYTGETFHAIEEFDWLNAKYGRR